MVVGRDWDRTAQAQVKTKRKKTMEETEENEWHYNSTSFAGWRRGAHGEVLAGPEGGLGLVMDESSYFYWVLNSWISACSFELVYLLASSSG